jgi:parvulin-like peptidyl-prolyl isomerase
MLRPLALSLTLLLACDAETPRSEPAKTEAPKVEPAKPEPAIVAPVKPAPDMKEACAGIVVYAWKGAEGAEPGVTRDEPAAKAQAEATREKLLGGIALAGSSDEPKTRAKNGAMGTYEREKWPEKYAAIADAVFSLQVGEVTPVIRMPLGYVVAQRCAVEKIHSRHILVRYKGAKNADETIKRDDKAARALAEKVHKEATAAGADFAALAKKYSEDGSSERGGDLGSVGRGMFAPAFEAAAFALKAGETSAVVETDFGFHVIQRVD